MHSSFTKKVSNWKARGRVSETKWNINWRPFYDKTNMINKNKGIFLTNMTNKVLSTKFWRFCRVMQNMTALSFLDGRFSYMGNIQNKVILCRCHTKCAIWDIHDFHCAWALGHIPYWFSHAVEGDGDDEDGFGLGRRAHIASLQFKASFNFQLSLGNGLGSHFYCMR